MHKVFAERPRFRPHRVLQTKPSREANLPEELLPQKQSLRARHPWINTSRELRGPFKRWLRSNLGRPWNDVYAELAPILRKQPGVTRRLKETVFCMVRRNTFIRDGRIWHRDWGREVRINTRPRCSPAPVFYVHPQSGVLMEARGKRVSEWNAEIFRNIHGIFRRFL